MLSKTLVFIHKIHSEGPTSPSLSQFSIFKLKVKEGYSYFVKPIRWYDKGKLWFLLTRPSPLYQQSASPQIIRLQNAIQSLLKNNKKFQINNSTAHVYICTFYSLVQNEIIQNIQNYKYWLANNLKSSHKSD